MTADEYSAAALISLKRYDEAIADCKKAIVVDPTYSKAHYRVCCTYTSPSYHISY